MSFGKAPSPPPAQPVTPVPQKDDPSSYDAQRKAAIAAKERDGMSAHLLSENPGSTTTDQDWLRRSRMLG